MILSAAQIHLVVNHLPVFAALLAGGTLLVAVILRRTGMRDLGFALLVLAAVCTLPAYFSGEGAEEIVEHRPGVSERLIKNHEQAAERALAITLTAGALGAAALIAARVRRGRGVQILSVLALISALVSIGSIGQTAHLGGQIRHDEIRPSGTATDTITSVPEGRKRHDADDD